jgi:ankyrin repeat protein
MFAAGLGWRNGSPAAPSYDQGTEQEAVAAIDYLLELGLDIDAPAQNGDTALHAATAGRKSEAIVAHLLERGADPLAENGRQQTPLALADSPRGSETIAALLRAAAAATP